MRWLSMDLRQRLIKPVPAELWWLLVAISLPISAHAPRLPVWITLLYLSLAVWRLSVPVPLDTMAQRRAGPWSWFRLAMGVAMFAGVFLSYGTLTGKDAGTALLVLLAGMKLMEIRETRDYYVAVFIALLLILTNFLYTQTLPASVYMAGAVLVSTGTLISLNDKNHQLNTRELLRRAGILCLQAVPLMVIMFVLFPRIPGPLWGLPKDANTAKSGVDDEMAPGSISQLTLSDEVVFRVEFTDGVPEPAQRYWRGPVLWFTDGFKWVPDKPHRPTARLLTSGGSYTYTVTLEATDKNWLYGLEMPAAAPNGSFFSHDAQLRTRTPVRDRQRYQLTSYTHYQLLGADNEELTKALQLPAGYHPKTIELGRSWRGAGTDSRALVQTALRYFNEQPFYYTLSPPLAVNDSVDEFLFDSRSGFCEHYAAAFVILMRAAGIPARVVTGYQGGTINPVGNYLIVRQRDAHAWTEVWLREDGWVRIDPTSAVAPERINAGLKEALPDAIFDVPLVLQNNAFARDLWERLAANWDALNNRWNQWVLGYDEKRQFSLLEWFGLKQLDHGDLILGLTLLLLGSLSVIAFVMFRPTAAGGDEARVWYEKFRARLARCGIPRRPQEGPLDFAGRASQVRFDLAPAIRDITQTYIAVRYGNHPEQLEVLKRQVQEFHPGKQPTTTTG